MKKILLLLAFLPFIALAKPAKVQCIAPAGAGGVWDFTCRVPAAQVMQNLDLVEGTIEVVNMSGAGGGKAFAHVASERKNDSNLIIAASMATAARLGQNVYAGFSAENVRWLGALGADYGVIAVSKDSKYTQLSELVSDLKNSPSSVSIVGGSAAGGWDHLKVLILADKGGVSNLKHINYVAFDNGAKAMLEVISNRADVFTGDTSEVLNYLDAGDIRVLAVLSPQKIDRLGDAKTAKEQGYDVIGANWRGFYAPVNISESAYDEWVNIIQTVANSSQWSALREKNGLASFESFGSDFEGFVKEQIDLVGKISRDLGFMK